MVCYVIEKSDLFLYLKKTYFYEEDLIHKIISCYMTQTKQTTLPDLFLYFKILQVLKIRFVSKEDTKSVLYF